ncbi:MAG: GTP-binding protein [Candidatus Saccharibacteria bacterium]|nr:GTP-binding protein [Candidatus Saccharibacteria bacterium]
MSRENFEVISLLGPLGSGKTTTLNNLIEKVPLADSYAVVVNDVGENNVDAQRIWDHPANRSEKIIPLTAGCIGCSDVTQFREALEKVHDAGVNVLFIEPTGIAPGNEIVDVVESSGFNLSVLTLANARTIERDMKWQVLPSQLAVANIVGITHIPEGSDNAEVMDTVLDQLPPLADDVTVELIKPGDTNYFEILANLRGMDKQLRLGRQTLHVVSDHDHHHDDDCSGHNISAKSYRLRPDASLEAVKQLLMPYTQSDIPLLRAKGVIGGMRFDVVGDEWKIQPDESSLQSMNVIFADHMPATFLDAVHDLSETQERVLISGDKKSVVKSVSDLPVKERLEIVNERVRQYPHPISPMHGEIIPDCEADEGYEIAFWGNKDDMPDDAKHLTMSAYISFRLEGLHELQHHSEKIANFDAKAAYWVRRFGATLGYNSYYLSDYIPEDSLSRIRDVNPARMLCNGLMALDKFTFDEGRAEEKPEFVASVMRAAYENDDVTMKELETLKVYMLKISKDNEDFESRWKTTFSFVD